MTTPDEGATVKLDTDYTTWPICPYCGHEDQDAWEIDLGGMEGDGETECGSCGKEMFISRHCEITYSTKVKP